MPIQEDRIVVFQTVSINQNGNLIAACNTLNLLNTGTTIVMIDSQIRLLPNMGYEFQCWPNEINKTSYAITFIDGAGLTNNLVVTRKIYKDNLK